MTEPLLSLRGVKTNIGRYHILHGVEFDVAEGGLTMLLGRNGAGKTTTLRTIMGLWRAAAGEIRFAGRDIAGLSTPTSRGWASPMCPRAWRSSPTSRYRRT